MYYYEVTSDLVGLSGKDSFISSKEKLNEFDIMLIDSEEYGFVVCRIAKEISKFEGISKPFKIGTYLAKKNLETYLKNKEAVTKADIILKKVEQAVKEIQYLEKLKKYSDRPEIQVLFEEYENIKKVTKDIVEDDSADEFHF